MVEDLGVRVGDMDLVEVAEAITIFAGAEGSGKRRAASKLRSKATADSSCLASLARRNDKKILGSDADDKVELELSPKELGEIAEAEFLKTVLRKKIAVSKPWGENQGYGFILDDHGRLQRVQVKAAFRGDDLRGYSLRAYRSSKRCYTAEDIDVLAGYVDVGKVWYLFPVRVIGKLRSLKLFPGSKNGRSKHEKWREAWWVVKR
jgi:hypothetical protein